MNKTILIVDDFKNTRFVVKFTLQNEGFNVLEAIDGQEALKLLDGRDLDLVITDFNMPRMNGETLVRKIRELPQYQYIPILMLSTETDSEKQQKAAIAGVTAWIQKPFKMDTFVNIVKKALK